MKKLKLWIVTAAFMIFSGASIVAITPQTATAAPSCSVSFLGFPTWYRGLINNNYPDCNIKNPNDATIGGISNFIWRIVLNIIDIGLRVVGFIAVGFILYGGFQFLTSAGDPARAASGRKTIFNAAIGIVISVASIAIVNLIVGNL